MTVASRFYRLRYGARHPMARAGRWALVIAVAGLTLSAAWWWPIASERTRLTDQIAQQRRALVAAREAVELQHAYGLAAQRAPELENKLRQTVSPAQLVESLGQLARRHGVRIVAEAYEEGRRERPPQSLVADLTLTGDYLALRRFIDGLAGLATWSIAEEVRLEVVRGGTDVRARLRVVTYFGGLPPQTGERS